ncbi:DUF1707 SHOCT-like domain-containing protein [Streptomyces sp. CA-111067]|uniref:DUF1707 SHOCT-like domain-containing protein n=1 Tax=Streptomyces sp. CA-111067 TaxID=3240046 RepID=UPI003D97570E
MSMNEPRDPRMLRVSHEDRDRVVEILRVAAGDGRLDAEELDERLERALRARTFADLEPLTEDLPVPQPAPPRLPEAVPAPAGLVKAEDEVAWSVHGVPMRREGAWVVPRAVHLDVHGGTARLDYTLARLPEGGASEIHVSVHGGSVRLMLPPGVAVDMTGVTRHGGSLRDRSLRHADSEVPITHVITMTGSVHGGNVKVMSADQSPSSRRDRRRLERARRSRRDGS